MITAKKVHHLGVVPGIGRLATHFSTLGGETVLETFAYSLKAELPQTCFLVGFPTRND